MVLRIVRRMNRLTRCCDSESVLIGLIPPLMVTREWGWVTLSSPLGLCGDSWGEFFMSWVLLRCVLYLGVIPVEVDFDS